MIGRGFNSRRLHIWVFMMRQKVNISILLLLSSAFLSAATVHFRFFDDVNTTRIVFEGSKKFEYQIQTLDDRIVIIVPERIELRPTDLNLSRSELINQVKLEYQGNRSLISTFFKDYYSVKRHFLLDEPFRIVFDLERAERTFTSPPVVRKEEDKRTVEAAPAVQTAKIEITPTATAKKKPIETICIDPGHGGGDLGAVGKSGALEKNLTLTVAKKLKRLLESRLGVRIIMTRDGDEEVSLNSRASIANNQQAQLFVSIHMNSSYRKTAFGSETYFVSLKATDQEAMELAQKENLSNENLGEEIQDDELKLILWNMAQTEYIKESSKLAEYIQFELNNLLETKNRGVKQAPFRVLMRSAMPSVLIEVAFLSNRSEEKKLTDDRFQDQVAQAVYNGVSRFISEFNLSLR